MKEPENGIALAVGEAKRLRSAYLLMSDIVQCQVIAISLALEAAREEPESFEELIKGNRVSEQTIRRQLDGFQRVLESALHLESVQK